MTTYAAVQLPNGSWVHQAVNISPLDSQSNGMVVYTKKPVCTALYCPFPRDHAINQHYCTTCKRQGHGAEDCPNRQELYPCSMQPTSPQQPHVTNNYTYNYYCENHSSNHTPKASASSKASVSSPIVEEVSSSDDDGYDPYGDHGAYFLRKALRKKANEEAKMKATKKTVAVVQVPKPKKSESANRKEVERNRDFADKLKAIELDKKKFELEKEKFELEKEKFELQKAQMQLKATPKGIIRKTHFAKEVEVQEFTEDQEGSGQEDDEGTISGGDDDGDNGNYDDDGGIEISDQ